MFSSRVFLPFLAIFLVVVLAAGSEVRSSEWDYTRAHDRPLIIAHRGDSSLFPENTLEAFRAAAYIGADFFELDVQMSVERELIVSHDAVLSRQTDVANRAEFAHKKQSRMLNGKNVTDWWICDFTVAELKSLHIRQTLVAGRKEDLNHFFTFPLLSEVLDMVKQFNYEHNGARNIDNNLVGVVIESKDREFYIQLYDIEQGQLIVDLLRLYGLNTKEMAARFAPIILHSFDALTVLLWHNITDLPNSLLGSFAVIKPQLKAAAKYAQIVGVSIGSLVNSTTLLSTGQIEQARAQGLMVHGWTFRDDALNWGKDYIEQYVIACQTLKITGIITEFPNAALTVVIMLRKLQENNAVISTADF